MAPDVHVDEGSRYRLDPLSQRIDDFVEMGGRQDWAKVVNPFEKGHTTGNLATRRSIKRCHLTYLYTCVLRPKVNCLQSTGIYDRKDITDIVSRIYRVEAVQCLGRPHLLPFSNRSRGFLDFNLAYINNGIPCTRK